MDQEGDSNRDRHQQQSPAESSRELPPPLILPAEPNSLWHDHETTLLTPFLANYIGDDQDHGQTSSYQAFFNMLSNVELLSPTPPRELLPPPPQPTPPSSLILPKIESIGGFEKGESSGTKRTSEIVQVSLPHSIISEVSTEAVERGELPQRPPRTRRRRSPQVHNLSERTRRSRINDRIRTLRELVPNCNKTDKASVLSDVIDYIKFLQQQVQMMKSAYESMLTQYYFSIYRMMPTVGLGGIYSSAYTPTGFPISPFQHPFGESPGFLHPQSQLQYHTPTETTTMYTAATSMGPTTATPLTSITSSSSTFSQGESSSAQYI